MGRVPRSDIGFDDTFGTVLHGVDLVVKSLTCIFDGTPRPMYAYASSSNEVRSAGSERMGMLLTDGEVVEKWRARRRKKD